VAGSGNETNEELVSALRLAIITGEYAPNQRLVEVDICERFGTKRGAVRIALLQLEGEGIVERTPHRGSRVRLIPVSEAVEISELRMLIESFCAHRAAERITDKEIAELRALRDAMRKSIDGDDLAEYSRLSRRLHIRVVQISAQPTARSVLIRLNGQNVRHQFRLSYLPGRAAVSFVEHEAIVEALAARDPKRAEKATQAHMRSVIKALGTLGQDDRVAAPVD
jgi:DNA-binding GntR family transcriptional regulator